MDVKQVSASAVWSAAYASAFTEIYIQASDDADIGAIELDMDGLIALAIDVANHAVDGLRKRAERHGLEVIE